jgi:hypothetical protein
MLLHSLALDTSWQARSHWQQPLLSQLQEDKANASTTTASATKTITNRFLFMV